MKNYLLIGFLFLGSISTLFCQTTPTTTWPVPSSDKVGLSFNSYEEYSVSSNPYNFHNGLDILCESGVGDLVAVEDGSIITITKQGASVNFGFMGVSGMYYLYGHCINSGVTGAPVLYTGSFPNITYSNVPIINIQKGDIIATTASWQALNFFDGYSHVHFSCIAPGPTSSYDYPQNTINPLDESFASAHLDPTPTIPPFLGPLILTKASNAYAFFQPISNKNVIYGDVDVAKELFDDMGSGTIPANQTPLYFPAAAYHDPSNSELHPGVWGGSLFN